MNKVLNGVISFLSFMIFVEIVLIVIFSFISYNVTINLNGATSVSKEEVKCRMTLLGCYTVLPEAVRDGGNVYGYSYNASDKEAEIKIGEKVKIEDDTELYVVSSRKYNVHIENNGVDFLAATDVSCEAYNDEESCTVKLPDFNKVGYQNGGYSKNKNIGATTPAEYYPFMESKISEDLVLYPKYTDHRDDGIRKIYPNSNVYSINGSFIEFDKNLSQRTINTYKGFLEEIKNKAPYLFVGQKINILSKSTFQSVWQRLAGGGGIILGICYGSSILGHPISRSIDVFYYEGFNDVENYRTLVHEMSHAVDMYYGYAVKGEIPEIYPADDPSIQRLPFDQLLDKIYSKERISAQPDILRLYSKYRGASRRPIDHQGYAYTKNLEFVAEAFSFYYMTYTLKEPSYSNAYIPDDLKKTIEKYICIASNGYKKTGC